MPAAGAMTTNSVVLYMLLMEAASSLVHGIASHCNTAQNVQVPIQHLPTAL